MAEVKPDAPTLNQRPGGRQILLLILLATLVAIAAIATDVISPRDRHPTPATTAPAAQPG